MRPWPPCRTRRLLLWWGGAVLICLPGLLASCDRGRTAEPEPAERKGPRSAQAPKSAGQEDDGPIEVADAAAQRILIEAETGELKPRMTARKHPRASGGKFIESPEGPDHKEIDKTGSATIRFNVAEQGEYYLWARVGWCCECGDSLDLAIDDGEEYNLTSGTHGYRWHWLLLRKRVEGESAPAVLKLNPGAHELHVYNREDGSGLDQVLLTTDGEYVPIGVEKP